MADNRLDQIASLIYGATKSISAADLERDDAKSALASAREKGTTAREGVMAELARLSSEMDWTQGECKDAVKLASRMGNTNSEKARATMMSEVIKAAKPLVRDHFEDLRQFSHDIWEAASTKDGAPCPPLAVKKVFSRRYILLGELLKQAEEGVLFTSVEDAVSHCRDKDPDLDADKVAKRLEKIRQDLADFHVDFPDEDIGAAVKLLDHITKKELVEARNRKLGVQPEIKAAPAKPDVRKLGEKLKPAIAAKPEKFIPVVNRSLEAEMAEGATNLDDLMGIAQLADAAD